MALRAGELSPLLHAVALRGCCFLGLEPGLCPSRGAYTPAGGLGRLSGCFETA